MSAEGKRALGVAMLAALAVADPPPAAAGAAERPGARPNVLLVLTDDQTLGQFRERYMPRTFHHLVSRGTWFRQAIAAPPLCCPARAGIISGQYAHNHGVSWQDYADLRGKRNVLARWLQRAGYRTAFFGKFLNRYPAFAGIEAAPGFDRWFAFHGPTRYLDWVASNGESLRELGSNRRAYSTTVLARKASNFVRGQARSSRPFFAWLSLWAPHGESGPHERCAGSAAKPERVADLGPFYGEGAPRTPAFDEADVSDKPPAVASRPPLDGLARRQVDRRWRCAVASLASVDRGIERLFATLESTGQLRDTLVVFASENGFLFGEHRITQGKAHFYEPVTRVPLVVRAPRAWSRGRPRVARSDAAVSTVDIAPTILAFADAEPCIARERCRRLDGRPLRPLLMRRSTAWSDDRAIPATLAHERVCAVYEAVRTPFASYLRDRAAPECNRADELYDLAADPFQLDNLAGSSLPQATALRAQMAARLDRAVVCTGVAGRDPRLAGRPHCE